jgi:hypothetical protein
MSPDAPEPQIAAIALVGLWDIESEPSSGVALSGAGWPQEEDAERRRVR